MVIRNGSSDDVTRGRAGETAWLHGGRGHTAPTGLRGARLHNLLRGGAPRSRAGPGSGGGGGRRGLVGGGDEVACEG